MTKSEAETTAVITVSETPELAVVITAFKAQSSEQLSLTPGQYVKIRKRSSRGWWEGEIQVSWSPLVPFSSMVPI